MVAINRGMSMATNLIGRRAALGGGALLAAGPLVRARDARAQQNAGPVRIGVLTDETGPYADSGGKGSVLAAQMAVADFGSTVLGRPIEIVHGDTQNKPDIAASLARQWYDSGVDAIVDLPVTSVASAVQQVAKEKNRTVMITAGAATEFTSKTCSPVSTHWADDTHALSVGAATHIVKSGGKTWYFITVDYAFGAALERDATEVITANGGRVLGTVSTRSAMPTTRRCCCKPRPRKRKSSGWQASAPTSSIWSNKPASSACKRADARRSLDS